MSNKTPEKLLQSIDEKSKVPLHPLTESLWRGAKFFFFFMAGCTVGYSAGFCNGVSIQGVLNPSGMRSMEGLQSHQIETIKSKTDEVTTQLNNRDFSYLEGLRKQKRSIIGPTPTPVEIPID